MLSKLIALGLAAPTTLSRASAAWFEKDELPAAIERLVVAAGNDRLAGFTRFELTGSDMPWRDLGLTVEAGQQVTFLLGGRWWLSRPDDLWVEPGVVFHARIAGSKSMYNPMLNSGTMTAARAGRLEVARSLGEWVDDDATLFTPPEVYRQADGLIQGVALVWNGDALPGLEVLRAEGDVGDRLADEIDRLRTERPLPVGWKNHFMFGHGGLFSTCGDGVICCQTHKTVGILQRDLSAPLEPGSMLDWRWAVDELPSRVAEDQVVTHDYLSIAVEFDDGQDITYLWSAALPQGSTFRCPIPRWTAIETHVAVRSGRAELGRWLNESRNLFEDYRRIIGGPAKRIVRTWLIANSVFMRRSGFCRYADIVVRGEGWEQRLT